MKLNSSKVTWLSFLLIVIVAFGFGFVGNRQIVKSLEEQFLVHGVAHNQEVAISLPPLLQNPLRGGFPRQEVIAQFQSALAYPHHLNGYNIFLVDADRSTILASSTTEQISDAKNSVALREWLTQFIAEAKAGQLSHRWTIHEETIENRILLLTVRSFFCNLLKLLGQVVEIFKTLLFQCIDFDKQIPYERTVGY